MLYQLEYTSRKVLFGKDLLMEAEFCKMKILVNASQNEFMEILETQTIICISSDSVTGPGPFGLVVVFGHPNDYLNDRGLMIFYFLILIFGRANCGTYLHDSG